MRDGNEVPRDDVASMFDDIAPVYDRLNTIMTFGLDNGWRHAAVEQTGIEPGASVADIACGTGKLTGELAERVGPFGKVIGVDLSGGMLALAEAEYRDMVQVEFRKGDALALPIDDDGVDAATIGFGMRNLANFEAGFRELARVVRPGGRVVCLELTMPRPRWWGRLYHATFRRTAPIAGSLFGRRKAYRYLPSSLEGYPDADQLAQTMRGAGLDGRVLSPPRAGHGRAPPRHCPGHRGSSSLAASRLVPDALLVGRSPLRRRSLGRRQVAAGSLRRGSFPPDGLPRFLARRDELVGRPLVRPVRWRNDRQVLPVELDDPLDRVRGERAALLGEPLLEPDRLVDEVPFLEVLLAPARFGQDEPRQAATDHEAEQQQPPVELGDHRGQCIDGARAAIRPVHSAECST